MYFHEQNPFDRRLNKPLHEEVAAIFTGENGVPPEREYVAISSRDNSLQFLKDYSEMVDPMSYPLLFPNGDPGFKPKMPHVGENTTKFRKEITLREFFSYRISIRDEDFCPIFFSRALFQQYLIDSYVKIESFRLNYLRQNQTSLRVDAYKVVSDHIKKMVHKLEMEIPRLEHQLFSHQPLMDRLGHLQCVTKMQWPLLLSTESLTILLPLHVTQIGQILLTT